MVTTDSTTLLVRIDSRLHLPPGLPRALVSDLKRVCTHANPDFHKQKRMGFATWGMESTINTWEIHDKGTPAESLSLPRGVTESLKRVATEHGFGIRFLDRRLRHDPVSWPALRFEPRWYQLEAIEACLKYEQGIVRAPTGSGKTLAALALAQIVGQPALVIMRDSNLLNQWVDVAVEKAGFHKSEIGILRGGSKLRTGSRLTLALQQTLHSESFPLEEVAARFGIVIVDEVHGVAAKTFHKVVGVFPARYRIGFSADETRKDKKEFLVYDQFGRVVYEIERDVLEDVGAITPVEVVLVPTEYRADWYRDAYGGERDFTRFMEELTNDDERNKLVVELVSHLSKRESPTLVFSHRVEHARELADVALYSAGVRCGLLLGGDDNRVRFSEDKARLKSGELPVCTGTFQAVGQGIDMPAVRSGVMSTPIGNNRQFFGQVRGRICRPADGKSIGRLYVAWDRHVFPEMLSKMTLWNGGRVRVAELSEVLNGTEPELV
jgi:superfamily II DNA or RNA helicase